MTKCHMILWSTLNRMCFMCLQSFEQAVDQVKNLKESPSDTELLEVYALYKQATIGDVNTGKTQHTYFIHYVRGNNDLILSTAKPGFLDFKGKAKWEAWNGKKGISSDEAKAKYVEFVEKLVKQIGLKSEN